MLGNLSQDQLLGHGPVRPGRYTQNGQVCSSTRERVWFWAKYLLLIHSCLTRISAGFIWTDFSYRHPAALLQKSFQLVKFVITFLINFAYASFQNIWSKKALLNNFPQSARDHEVSYFPQPALSSKNDHQPNEKKKTLKNIRNYTNRFLVLLLFAASSATSFFLDSPPILHFYSSWQVDTSSQITLRGLDNETFERICFQTLFAGSA